MLFGGFLRAFWLSVILGGTIQLAWGQVIINELVATSSDRLLQRVPGAYPRVGNTTPWQDIAYDDSRWGLAAGPFGFGTFSGVTIATDLAAQLQYRAASLYLRKTFVATPEQAASGAAMELRVRYNDGFIAFLNGVEIARRNMGNPGMFAFHDQDALNPNLNTLNMETIPVGNANTRLVAGDNVLCLQVHNHSASGANFLIQADLQMAGGETLADHQSFWKYFPGLSEPSGGLLDYGLYYAFVHQLSAVAWTTRGFDDADWPVSPGPVGIEGANPPDYLLGTNLYQQVYNITPTIYSRLVFSLSPEEAAAEAPLRLTLDYDDGVIVYLNGREVARRNVGKPGVPTARTAVATSIHDANGDQNGAVTGREEILLLGSPKSLLVAGDNVLAVQLHNAAKKDEDAIVRVTLETTGSNGRVLCQPTDIVRFFVGTQEPSPAPPQSDIGPIASVPDGKNDWIELHNSGSAEVSFDGWALTDNASNPQKWLFPGGTTIPGGGFLLVLATGLDIGPADGATYLHANFSLSASGEYLALINAEGQVVSELSPTYPVQNVFHSYGRDTNGNWGFLAEATPGAPNVGPALAAAPSAPEFSISGGFHDAPVSLVITSTTAGADIYYTLDGSEPNPGLRYTGPILISTNQVVRARAVQDGAIPSATLTHTYLIGVSAAKKSLPALCLGGDPVLTYYGPNTSGGPAAGEGIFAIKGGVYTNNEHWSHGGDSTAFSWPLQRGRATEKPGTLEFYPPNGDALRTGVGVRLAGSTDTRLRCRLTDAATAVFNPWDWKQKPSFNLFFRPEWNVRPIDYPLFGDLTVRRFKDVRLRAGKNDPTNPFIRDEYIRRIFLAMGQKGSAGIFTTVYINGIFKGYYNLCERLREGFMQEQYHSTEAWDVQQLTAFSSGDPSHWNQTMAYIRSADLTNTANYLQVRDYLDVDNYIDYIILNAFAATADWPNNNWVAARERSPQGRWRFYVWDAEGGFGYYGHGVTYNTFTNDLVISNPRTGWYYPSSLYTLLRGSPEFRLRFADRVQKHFFNDGCMVKTNLQTLFFSLRDAINPIMRETTGTFVSESFYNVWIASDTRRINFFDQLREQGLWPDLLSPTASHYGGEVVSGMEVALNNPNNQGAIYFTTDGTDPRAPGGDIAGQLYGGPITVSQAQTLRARVRDAAGDWSPEIVAEFITPPPVPIFQPAGSGDWTQNDNWSSAPLAYPNRIGGTAIIPPGTGADRDVNLRAPVTIGQIVFPQGNSLVRNRVRDRGTGNTLKFQNTHGPARLEVGGWAEGYVEFEVAAGTTLQSDLQLHVTNLVGHAEHGALRLRAGWFGAGGLIKSGPGVASLTGDGKIYTGATQIEEGVLQVTQPATPTASSNVIVRPGGQLRLISRNDTSGPRVYSFGGPLLLEGSGRSAAIPDQPALGRLGALRYDPGTQGNQTTVVNALQLTGPAQLHVAGARNILELAGVISGSYPITKSGGGTLRLAANNQAFTSSIQVTNGTLELAGSLGSPVNLAETGILSGYGQVGQISGSGVLWLKQSILQAEGVAVATHRFVFGKTGSPLYAQPAAAGNGLVVLPTAPTGLQALDVYLTTPLNSGDVLRGGYFVPFAVNLAEAMAAVPKRVFAPDPQGDHIFDRQTWSLVTNAQFTSVSETADFGQGVVHGRILEVRIGGSPTTFATWQAIAFPDPSALADPLVSGPGADPLGTGVPNLLRYALGLSLSDDPTGRTPQFSGSATAPAIRFAFDAGCNDIAYVVEATGTLADWSSARILFDSRTDFPPVSADGWISISDPAAAGTQQYYRLRVHLIDGQ